jgi:hypothetical protein
VLRNESVETDFRTVAICSMGDLDDRSGCIRSEVLLGPFQTVVHVARDLVALTSLAMRLRAQLAAENLLSSLKIGLAHPRSRPLSPPGASWLAGAATRSCSLPKFR